MEMTDLSSIPRNERGIEVYDKLLGMLPVKYGHCWIMTYDMTFEEQNLTDE